MSPGLLLTSKFTQNFKGTQHFHIVISTALQGSQPTLLCLCRGRLPLVGNASGRAQVGSGEALIRKSDSPG